MISRTPLLDVYVLATEPFHVDAARPSLFGRFAQIGHHQSMRAGGQPGSIAAATAGSRTSCISSVRTHASRRNNLEAREIRISEWRTRGAFLGKIQFRAEAYNLIRVNLGTPAASLTAVNFGQISSAGAARAMQFALRYDF
jgi:hypothetical protein